MAISIGDFHAVFKDLLAQGTMPKVKKEMDFMILVFILVISIVILLYFYALYRLLCKKSSLMINMSPPRRRPMLHSDKSEVIPVPPPTPAKVNIIITAPSLEEDDLEVVQVHV